MSSNIRQRTGKSTAAGSPAPTSETTPSARPRVHPFSVFFFALTAATATYFLFYPGSKSLTGSDGVGGEGTVNTFKRYPVPVGGWDGAREEVVVAIQESYRAYATSSAWGSDDFFPEHGTGGNLTAGGSIGYFIVDVLDTMLLTPGMEKDYARAKEYVRDLSFDVDGQFNAFETTIRVLGGLLAAYALDGQDPMYLAKAIDLGERILPIFNTPTGIPYSFINLKTRQPSADKDNNGYSSLAEATTLQLEFKYLAEISGRSEFWDAAEKTMMAIRRAQSMDGLLPILVSPETGAFFFHIRLGSRGDSYYEMLIKQYLQTGSNEPVYREMYDQAMTGIKDHLVKETSSGLVYAGELHPSQNRQTNGGWTFVGKMDHLVCFLGGSFMLGVTEGVRKDARSFTELEEEDWTVGKELIRSCVDTYENSKTGLGPEIVEFLEAGKKKEWSEKREWKIPGAKRGAPPLDARNILRPETVESLFLGWRASHDPIYREWGWQIFSAFKEHCRLPISGAYTSIRDVDEVPVVRENKMETFLAQRNTEVPAVAVFR